MLCIARKHRESFVLQDRDGKVLATIKLIDSNPKAARIGIEAPKEIAVIRTELLSLPNYRKEPRREMV